MNPLFALALGIKSDGLEAGKRHLAEIDQAGKKVAKNFVGMINPLNGVKAALGGIAAGLTAGAITAFLGKAIDEANDAEAALSELRSAVNNVGGDFELLEPATDKAAASMQRLTRFSDDLTRRALATMITVSGDTAGSLKNIGLAADVAAAKHIDLNSAAELIARTMTGNTRALMQFGIRTNDASKGIEILRQRVAGFAEQDGKTFQGRLEQMHNAFTDVLESLGRVIVGGDDMAGVLANVTVKLGELSGFIDDNAEKWRGWAKFLFDDEGGPLKGLTKLASKMERIAQLRREFALNLGRSGGGGGGGRDTPTGTPVLSPVVVNAPRSGTGNNIPTPMTTTGKDTGVKLPNPNINFGSVDEARIGQIGAEPLPPFEFLTGMTPDELKDVFRGFHDGIQDGADMAADALKEYERKVAEGAARIKDTITQGMANTLGDAIYNSFAAAFNGEGLSGIFAAFGKTILAGVGQMFTQLGMIYLEYGGIMSALSKLLPNPFTAGPAGIAIGAALIAMGSALGAVAKGGGGRGTATAGAFREARGTTEVTRLKFVNRDGSFADVKPVQPLHFTIIGANDPKVQRELGETVYKYSRRQG